VALSSGRRSSKDEAIRAQVVGGGLYAVADAYSGAYDFFGPSVLFPDEPDAHGNESVDLEAICEGGEVGWAKPGKD
jgi:hypothetical protein